MAIRRARALNGGIWLVVIGTVLIPAFSSLVPPGGDFTVHLARVFVLKNLGIDADLQRFYEPSWRVLPNLAFDVTVLPLMQWMGPFAAARVFLVVTVLVQFASVALLRHQLYGRVGLLPLVFALFVYGSTAAHGLAAFQLGQGLLLFGVSIWLATRAWSWKARLVAMSATATVLFFTHLLILGFYGAVLGLMRLQALRRNGQWEKQSDIPLVGQFAVPALLWSFVDAPSHGTETEFGGIMARLRGLASPILYHHQVDFALAAVLLVVLLWLLGRRRLRVHPVLAMPLLVLALLSLFMPEGLFGVWLVNIRLPPVLVMLFIAAVDVDIADRGLRAALVALLVVVGAMKFYKVENTTLGCDARQRQFLASLGPVPRGARILPVIEPKIALDCLYPVYWHMPALAVIEKSVFYPLMALSKWPLDFKPELRRLRQQKPRPVSPGVLRGNLNTFGESAWNRKIAATWREDFDYLVWLYPGTSQSPRPVGLTSVGGGDFFTLYRIDKRRGAGD